MSVASPLHAAVHPARARDFERAALEQARQFPSHVDRCLTLATPTVAAPEALLELDEEVVFWSGRDNCLRVGLGALEVLTAQGTDRFASLERQGNAALTAFESHGLMGAPAPSPLLFGGFAFHPGQAHAEPWKRFGDARFVLPRLLLQQQGDQCWLSLNLRRGEPAEPLLEQAFELRARLSQLQVDDTDGPVPSRRAVEDKAEEETAWCALVNDILGRIESGACTKVVAALRSELACAQGLSVASTLRALGHNTPSTRFAFKQGNASFCGATPERLIHKSGLELQTEALAGTFNRSDASYAQELLRSPKEHQEHAPVLREIVEALAPVCSELEHPAQPEIFELPHLLHLKSPVRAKLEQPTHILELVERLHPTPAVGGVPRAFAQAWISEHEAHERGWYAGPVGWFDAQGDGDFYVALRSGVLCDTRAFLFAGAGIVAGSEPHTEYAETQLKLRSLRASLRS